MVIIFAVVASQVIILASVVIWVLRDSMYEPPIDIKRARQRIRAIADDTYRQMADASEGDPFNFGWRRW
jgi:hypothetical protein